MTGDRSRLDFVNGLADLLQDLEQQARDTDFEGVFAPFREFFTARNEHIRSARPDSVAATPDLSLSSSQMKERISRVPIVTTGLIASLIHERHRDNSAPASTRGLLFGTDFEPTDVKQARANNIPETTPVETLEKELDRLVNQVADVTVESMKSKS